MLLGNGKLLPEEKFAGFTPPEQKIPRSPGHWVEWVNYAKGNGPVPGSNFQYSGWTTECNHLGNVAYRAGKKLEWDYASLRATNAPEVAPLIRRPAFRAGWQGIFPLNISCPRLSPQTHRPAPMLRRLIFSLTLLAGLPLTAEPSYDQSRVPLEVDAPEAGHDQDRPPRRRPEQQGDGA